MDSASFKKYERSLVTRLTLDSEDAFCEIYALYKDRLVYFAQKYLKSRESAEDVCHDTFAIVWEMRHIVDPDSSFSSFIYTIARNRILYLLRAEQTREKFRDAILKRAIDYQEGTQEEVLANELQEIIRKAVDKLSPRQREIFEMSREKNMTHKEIADTLGLSVYTVQEHVSASLKIIRDVLRKHYGASAILLLMLAIHC